MPMTPRLRRSVAAAILAATVASACGGGTASSRPASPAGPGASASPPTPAAGTTSPSAALTAGPSEAGIPSNVEWAALSAAGPAAREDHTWTVDRDAQAAWLFGGRDGATVFDDLWRFDLGTDEWEQITPSGPTPPARFGHTGTWINGVGLAVWSGQAGERFFDDLWVFDPRRDAWRELPATGPRPPARYGSCAVAGADRRLWISHGFTADAGRFADTWRYDFSGGTWEEVTPDGTVPVERCLHDCLWTPDGRFVLYGGQTTDVAALGDLWTRPGDGEWSKEPDPPAPARQLYALAVDRSTAWVFGGGAQDGSRLADVWALDLESMAWQSPEAGGSAPAPRSAATLVPDYRKDRLVLFGGLTDDGASGELFELRLRR